VAESLWPSQAASWANPAMEEEWAQLLQVRDLVMKALEERRIAGTIGTSLEAAVTVTAGEPRLASLLRRHAADLPTMWVVSVARVAEGWPTGGAPVAVAVARAAGRKCQRCWMWTADVGSTAVHPTLCQRCVQVLTS